MKKTNNKQIRDNYRRWANLPRRDIYDVYARPSSAKESAWAYCLRLCESYNGYGLKVIGFNSMTFSAGFVGKVDDLRAFFYITRDYDRFMMLEEVDPNTGEVIDISADI